MLQNGEKEITVVCFYLNWSSCEQLKLNNVLCQYKNTVSLINIYWPDHEINGLIHSQQGWIPKGNQWFSIWKSK